MSVNFTSERRIVLIWCYDVTWTYCYYFYAAVNMAVDLHPKNKNLVNKPHPVIDVALVVSEPDIPVLKSLSGATPGQLQAEQR